MTTLHTYDCDGCGQDVRSTADPHDVVLVLCTTCNGGMQVPSPDPDGEHQAWLDEITAIDFAAASAADLPIDPEPAPLRMSPFVQRARAGQLPAKQLSLDIRL